MRTEFNAQITRDIQDISLSDPNLPSPVVIEDSEKRNCFISFLE